MKGLKGFLKTVLAWAATATLAGLMTVSITVFVIKDQVISLQSSVARIERKMDMHLIQHTKMAGNIIIPPTLTKGGSEPPWRIKENQNNRANRAAN